MSSSHSFIFSVPLETEDVAELADFHDLEETADRDFHQRVHI